MVRVAGCLQKSTAVMEAMNQLVRLPEIRDTMMQLSKEMMKAGLIEEMVADSFDSVMDDDEELDDQAESEVRRLALARVYFTRF